MQLTMLHYVAMR